MGRKWVYITYSGALSKQLAWASPDAPSSWYKSGVTPPPVELHWCKTNVCENKSKIHCFRIRTPLISFAIQWVVQVYLNCSKWDCPQHWSRQSWLQVFRGCFLIKVILNGQIQCETSALRYDYSLGNPQPLPKLPCLKPMWGDCWGIRRLDMNAPTPPGENYMMNPSHLFSIGQKMLLWAWFEKGKPDTSLQKISLPISLEEGLGTVGHQASGDCRRKPCWCIIWTDWTPCTEVTPYQ